MRTHHAAKQTSLILLIALPLIACGEDRASMETPDAEQTQAKLLEGAEQVFVGYQTACARTEDDKTYCWGFDHLGQVGDGLPARSQQLAVVVEGFDAPVERIDGALDTMCGITQAGSVYCWGDDRDGALGPGDPMLEYRDVGNPFLDGSFAVTPQLVFEGTHLDVDFAGAHGCAVSKAGEISCWGKYSLFSQGGETFDSDAVHEIEVSSWTPVSIASTEANDCALDDRGKVWCWGTGENGALGVAFDEENPAFESCSTTLPNPTAYKFCAKQPVETAPLGGVVTSLVGGGRGGFCALREDGIVMCWGDNASERFASADSDPLTSPIEVTFPGKVTSIALGEQHLCGLLEDGRVFCSGDGALGQTGESSAAAGQPIEVPLGQGAKHLSAGYHSSCAVLEDGHIACWGLNNASQLGVPRDPEVDTNDSDIRAKPVLVQLASDAEVSR